MSRRSLPLTAALAALALAAPGAAPAGAATWSAPQSVSAPHTFVEPLLAATLFDGSTLASWSWQDNVGDDALGGAAAAVRRAGAPAFGPQRTAPDGLLAVSGYARSQALGLALQGLPRRSGATGALLYRVRVAFADIRGVFGAQRTLATAPVAGLPQLATAPGASTALVAYAEITRTSTGATRRVVRAVDRRGGRWGRPYTLSGKGRADAVAADANAAGDQVVAFAREGQVLARVRRHGHGWGSLQRLARADGRTQWRLAAGVAPNGQARVVWRRHQLRTASAATRNAIESAAMLAGRGTFTPAQTLTSEGASTFTMAPTAQGWAVAYVQATPAGPRPALSRTTGGSRFAPQILAAPAQGGIRDAQAVETAERAIAVAWIQPLPGQNGDGQARAATLAPGAAAFGAVEDVSPPEAAHAVRLTPATALWSARPAGTGPGIPLDQIRTFVRAATRAP